MSADGDDATLISRAMLGETSAYGLLVARYQRRVFGYLSRLCRDRHGAEDIAQDTFIRAWDKLGTFRGDGSFEGWLLRISYTLFLQAYRRRKKHGEVSLELQPDFGHAPTDASVAETPDLARMLAVLEPEIQTMLVLTYAYGYTSAEIARIVDMPTGTVKSHVSRAKTKIRQAFDLTSEVA